MKKYLTWLLLPTALVAILALLIHFKKLPADFWSRSLADKWKALKAFWSSPSVNLPTPPTGPTPPPTTSGPPAPTVAGLANTGGAQMG